VVRKYPLASRPFINWRELGSLAWNLLLPFFVYWLIMRFVWPHL
jgi:hypothetical protein